MAIEAQELEIQIGARTLLHPTNFHVAKGDKIGLVGRNGAGKTTLTRVITGDMLPTAGKVRVSGKLNRPVLRNLVVGTLAMGLTYAAGTLVGTQL